MRIRKAQRIYTWTTTPNCNRTTQPCFRPAPYTATVSPGAHDHFSLADPGTVERVLGAAGFADVKFSDVREPVYYGESIDAAMEWVRGFRFVRNVLQRLDAAAAARLLASLRDALAKKSSENGV